jgi:hypothetical protein
VSAVGTTTIDAIDRPVADPWLATTVTFPAERGGPPGIVNGGWVAGTVAAHLGPGPVDVALRAPTPLDTPVDLRVADDRATLTQDDALLVAAHRSPGPVGAPAPAGQADARAARDRFAGWDDHPFPGCFVCGRDRQADGMGIFPGAVAGPPAADGGPSRVAALFRPDAALAGDDGRLAVAAAWAALDCPTAWVNIRPGSLLLLGRMRAEVRDRLRPGVTYQVVAERGGRDGRKAYARAAVYAPGGDLMAASEALWIDVAGRFPRS